MPCCTKSDACPFRGLGCAGSMRAVTCATASLVELRSRSEFYKTAGSVTRLGASSPDPHVDFPTRGFDFRASVLPSLPCDATRTTILSSGSVLLQGMTRSPCRMSLDIRRLSWGLCPYSACRWEESTWLPPAVPSAGYVPSPGFRTLSTAFSSPHLARAFRRKQHSWGSPFRGFPSRAGPRAHRSRVCPLDVVPSACALSS
jgi:hypothetical protein